jgi:hypothetical protein
MLDLLEYLMTVEDAAVCTAVKFNDLRKAFDKLVKKKR